MTFRVVIADDHPIVRMGVRQSLRDRHDLSLVAEADSAASLLDLLKEYVVDIVITDFSMPVGAAPDGLDLIRRIRRERPAVAIIVLTMIANAGVYGSLLDLGVRAILNKTDGIADIHSAIDAIAAGRSYLSATCKQRLLESQHSANSPVRLSPKESEVIRLYASGLSVSDIAKRLSRSIKTISQQKADSMVKLGLRNDRDIYDYAKQHKLIVEA